MIKNKVVNALDYLKGKGSEFDLIILDPPYEEGQYEAIVDKLNNDGLLSENAVIVMEANRPIKLENIDYQKNKEYHYGEIMVFIYRR
ncbi:MAG: RsmD family RNA methyltransferase [Bacilli bacterium]|nr:RsmD family RNA methyltransferase [Bacilli bacterium]